VLLVARYLNSEPHRAFYGGLAAALAIAMVVQYRRESALVRNALSATAVVTSYRVVGKSAPHPGKGVPVFKYEFVAFDQQTYTGETGLGRGGTSAGFAHHHPLQSRKPRQKSVPWEASLFTHSSFNED